MELWDHQELLAPWELEEYTDEQAHQVLLGQEVQLDHLAQRVLKGHLALLDRMDHQALRVQLAHLGLLEQPGQ